MRKPDFVIGGAERPYMLRWWVIPRNRWFNIYLHKVLRDDDDRALHDHPWWNISIVLRGGYVEVMPDKRRLTTPFTRISDMPVVRKLRRPGSFVLRRATDAHRLELVKDGDRARHCWSLFITGPVQRQWGFHCAQGWRSHPDFAAADDPGQIGRGCA